MLRQELISRIHILHVLGRAALIRMGDPGCSETRLPEVLRQGRSLQFRNCQGVFETKSHECQCETLRAVPSKERLHNKGRQGREQMARSWAKGTVRAVKDEEGCSICKTMRQRRGREAPRQSRKKGEHASGEKMIMCQAYNTLDVQ